MSGGVCFEIWRGKKDSLDYPGPAMSVGEGGKRRLDYEGYTTMGLYRREKKEETLFVMVWFDRINKFLKR